MKNDITPETMIWDNGSETVVLAGDLWEPGSGSTFDSFEAFAEHLADEFAAGQGSVVVCDRTVTIDEEHDGMELTELFPGEIATNEEGFGGALRVSAGTRVDIWARTAA